jgi:hypothetical protein
MKPRTLSLILLACTMLFTYYAYAQELQDVVYLKNGSIIRGIIIEQIPNKTLKIKTADGSVFVYQMDDIARITREAMPVPLRSSSASVSSSDRVVVAVNPLGAMVGGVSWLSYERYMGENLTYQIRGDIWTYSTTTDDRGYYYHEKQLGFGAGGSARAYVLSSQPYSGLFGAFGIDALFTGWNWEERMTSYASMTKGDGSTATVVLSAQVGFAIAISNVRLEPSLAAGYFLLRQKGVGVVGVFVSPAMQIGIMF